jgi:hypothetical protein
MWSALSDEKPGLQFSGLFFLESPAQSHRTQVQFVLHRKYIRREAFTVWQFSDNVKAGGTQNYHCFKVLR